MRAIVITSGGGPEVLEMQERPLPDPGAREIRVRVYASALNRADLQQRRGVYPAPPGAPADIPGMEYAGEVEALGPGATMWPIGARVMGLTGGGAHAEYLIVHEREAIAVPALLTWAEAGAIPEVFITAYDALFRQLHLQLGETVLIHAVGSGVGTAAAQLAHVAGATVIGTSRSIEKLDRARELGVDIGIDSLDEGWPERVAEATGGRGVDAILDLVGGSYLANSIKTLSLRGRLILVGLTAGRSADLDLGMILNKRIQITGTVLRARQIEEKIAVAREFEAKVVPLLESQKVRPVVDRVFDFTEIRDAHKLMETNSNFGKIVLVWR
ncbi:MAG TPA: NAD(P)H-quinone oxidoreductase [Gemmatimonadaceae bacterium]|nr:NAD(P)H-quinone oxidoreductase [Gemmatimonadaceae bacterium]